ncbi:helix-hairpin-helix domain-containing protein [Domibacillus robiginosus]|uniref:helix-hairpin-helix domain-containing protein n=1 Tax=Domibacillus robiginosus TaxID=1071054 RepID=UPI00067C4B88|nr:helix-hairpin-helix domain-containing protein [Domibacillus robiginosus]
MNTQEIIKKYKIPAAAGTVLAIAFLYSLTKEEPAPLPPEPAALVEEAKAEPEAQEAASAQAQPVEVAIDVKGAVSMPGIYVLSSDQRVNDAINRAGGLTEKADVDAINLAQKVQDEMVVYVPAEGEEVPAVQQPPLSSAPSGNETSSDSTAININTADSSLLQELPGIGESKAQAIIDFRETEGAFTAVEDLKEIAGIGDKTFEKLAPLITVQ